MTTKTWGSNAERSAGSTRRWRRLAPVRLAIGAVAMIMGIAACSSSGSDAHQSTSTSATDAPTSVATGSSTAPTSGPPSTAQSTPNGPTTASIEASAQSVWLNYWRLSVALAKTPEGQRPAKVAALAVNPIYGEVLNSIRGELAAGLVPFGYITSRPSWPTPPAATATKAIMADCFDGTHAGTKAAKTGKTKTIGQPRTNTRVTFVKGSDARWRIAQIEYLKTSC